MLKLEIGRCTCRGESLLVILLVGLVAGWLAGQIVRGTGFGLIGDLLIGENLVVRKPTSPFSNRLVEKSCSGEARRIAGGAVGIKG
jgi:F0F1-type ATP synthase assembly protein I